MAKPHHRPSASSPCASCTVATSLAALDAGSGARPLVARWPATASTAFVHGQNIRDCFMETN